MKIFTFIIFILIVFSSCKSTEKELLHKKFASGYYGKLSDNKIIYNLTDLIKNKNTHLNNTVKVEGLINEVCPMRGCWLELKTTDGLQKMRLKVTDGDIVFPLSAKGKNSVAEGLFSILELNKEQALKWKKHLAEEKGQSLNSSEIILNPNDFFEYRLNTVGAKIF